MTTERDEDQEAEETPRNDSRWTEPPLCVIRKLDGSVIVPEGANRRHLLRVGRAWRKYRQTGDRRPLVKLGILPDAGVDFDPV